MIPADMPDPAALRLVSLADRPDLEDALDAHNGGAWPEFMLQDPVADRLWHHLHRDFAAWQFMLLDGDDRIAAAGNSAPLAWDQSDEGLPAGWDDQFERTVRGWKAGAEPDTLGALQVVVAPRYRGAGLAARMVEVFRTVAAGAGFSTLIACVRPTGKDRYPLLSSERYAAWRREDGLPFDPWLRLHVRLGGRVVRAAPESMTISGSLADWERWTGLRFPESGPYIVPFATNPVLADVEADRVVYHDANIWVVHDLG
jgi:GNAT superfamily N-acetyltransferase